MLRRSIICFSAAFLWGMCSLWGVAARADDGVEYRVKAAFIFNFVKFVEWPDGKAISKQSKMDVCVLGESDLLSMAHVFTGASTPKLSLALVSEPNLAAVSTHCHMVFIAASEEGRLAEILGALQHSPVLTVSDIAGFADHGGDIGFTLSDNKVKLEINKKAIAAAGLRIDAQLLEIALRVIDK